MNAPTPELIRTALQFIPANLPREDWARVGMAIKSEFDNDTGRDLFADWSATADGFDTMAVKSTWQSIKASGGVGIGTLLHLAKENGFTVPKPDQPRAKPDPAIAARLASEKAANQQVEQARQQAAHANAATDAAMRWEQASDTGNSPYLTRKGVQPYGVRFAADGWLLVPVRDASGALLNLQRIAPDKPTDGGPDKLFLKGGPKRGLWHWCGDPAGAAVLLVAEGYATAASVHQATSRPVAVAFDAGNLAHVVIALHKAHPSALIVVCGDDDRDTEARTGTNTGRLKATAAAKAGQGIAVFPEGLPDGGSDFNDLHQHLNHAHGGDAGLVEVLRIVDAALLAHEAAQRSAQAAAASTTSNGGQSRSKERVARSEPGSDFDRYTMDDSGVWFNGVDGEGKSKPPEWICSPLEVVAMTRDQDGDGWGYLLSFTDPIARAKQWAMPSRMLSGDGGEYRATLLNMGLRIAQSPRARNLLSQYIQTRKPNEFASCTDRIGWHGRAFVLPKETIGDTQERIVFQTDTTMENTFRFKGPAVLWQERVGALCAGNSRLVFAVACAFAGPLMRPAGIEGGGFHFRGNSSSGKTTALKVAASVYGGANYLRTWNFTGNALEATAAHHNDCLLILDELAQVDSKVAGDVAYMLANGQGKGRANRGGGARSLTHWRVLFLSAGEIGLADHMAEGMKRVRAGQEARMADIPADAGAGLGAFEELHGCDGGASFAKHIAGAAGTVYGAVGLAWLQWITEQVETLKASIRKESDAFLAKLVPDGASGQVERVGARFALVAAAGEMATQAGLTGWYAGESERAATACFTAWLAARGGAGNAEVRTILRMVRNFLEANGEGRFTWWHRATDDRNAKTLNRCGFRRLVYDDKPIKSESDFQREFGDVKSVPADAIDDTSTEFFVMADTFRTELCGGYDHNEVARILRDHGCLRTEAPDRLTYKTRLPSIGAVMVRCYCITSKIFELDI